MATVKQTWNGAQTVASESPSITSEYHIFDEPDEFLAEIALNAATPNTLGAWVKKSVSILERKNVDTWLGEVTWGAFETKEIGDQTFSFDTSGGTAHVQTSLFTLSRTPAPGVAVAPNFQGCIGVTDDGVEGVDITAPSYTFEESHFFALAFVTAAYKATLFSLTGAWNNAAYKGFAVGECMFMGAAGSLKDHAKWEINYRFKAVPNRVNFAFGPITVPLKRGHDYIWGRYREVEDVPAGHLARRPIAAYVEQVSPAGNLTLIGIGS